MKRKRRKSRKHINLDEFDQNISADFKNENEENELNKINEMKDGKSDGISVILSQRAKKMKAKKTRNKE